MFHPLNSRHTVYTLGHLHTDLSVPCMPVYLTVIMLILFLGDPRSSSPICPWNLYGSWASCHGNKEYTRHMVLPWIQLICSLIYFSFLWEGAERGRWEEGRSGEWGKKKGAIEEMKLAGIFQIHLNFRVWESGHGWLDKWTDKEGWERI